LNLRTYVRLAGEPGVWFLSLDATNPLATLGGRIGFSLPYFLAHAELEASEGERGKRYRFVRVPLGSSRLRFDATWTASGPARPAPAQSLESFLVERYTMYVVRFSRLARTRIFHPRWEIRPADVLELDTNVGEPYGLRVVTSEVVAYEQGATV
jgi:hypothetical protein